MASIPYLPGFIPMLRPFGAITLTVIHQLSEAADLLLFRMQRKTGEGSSPARGSLSPAGGSYPCPPAGGVCLLLGRDTMLASCSLPHLRWGGRGLHEEAVRAARSPKGAAQVGPATNAPPARGRGGCCDSYKWPGRRRISCCRPLQTPCWRVGSQALHGTTS